MDFSTVRRFVHREFEPIDSNLFEGCQYVRLVLNILELISYSLLVYIVLKKSPKAMHTYRWYIIINSTQLSFLSLFSALFHIYSLSPYSALIVRGPFKYFNISPTATYWAMLIFASLVMVCSYTVSVMFIYRFLQTTSSKYVNLLSNFWFYFLGYFIYLILIVSLLYLAYSPYVEFTDKVRMRFRDVNAVIYQLISNESLVFAFIAESQILEDKTLLIANFILFLLIVFLTGFLHAFISIYCSLASYKSMRHNTKLHPETKALFRKLLNMLVIEDLICLLCISVPVISIILCQRLQLKWSSSVVTVCFIFIELYPPLHNFLIILYIQPYRKGLMGLLRKVRCIGRRPSSRAVSVVTETLH